MASNHIILSKCMELGIIKNEIDMNFNMLYLYPSICEEICKIIYCKIKDYHIDEKILHCDSVLGDLLKLESSCKDENRVLLINDVVENNHILNIPNISKIITICDKTDKKSAHNIISIFTSDDILNYRTSFSNFRYFGDDFNDNLYKLALKKKSNIIVSCDLTQTQDILHMIGIVGRSIIGIKLHSDIIDNFSIDFVDNILKLKKEYEFIIIEDMKLADITSISILKLTKGIYKFSKWVDCVTIHGIVGMQTNIENIPKLIMVTELSSSGSLINEEYIEKCLEIKNINAYVCQDKTIKIMKNKYDSITLSPGINLDISCDNYDQVYTNCKKGMFWIVGRGIYMSNDIVNTIERYRETGWKYLMEW